VPGRPNGRSDGDPHVRALLPSPLAPSASDRPLCTVEGIDVTAPRSSLEGRDVVDPQHGRLGTLEALGDASGPDGLRIRLEPDARRRLELEDDAVTLPFEDLDGIRRDHVRVTPTMDELLGGLPEAKPDG